MVISQPDLQQDIGSECLDIESLLIHLVLSVAERLGKTCDEWRL